MSHFKTLMALCLLAFLSAGALAFDPGENDPLAMTAIDDPSLGIGSLDINISMGMDSAFSSFTEYYFSSSSTVGGWIGNPVMFDIIGHEPERIYLGGEGASPLSYLEYSQSPLFGDTNELWIAGMTSWNRYIISPPGTTIHLLAKSPSGGLADIYEIRPGEQVERRQQTLFPGLNQMEFVPDGLGRNIIMFVASNQPSNPVIVDVISDKTIAGPGAFQDEDTTLYPVTGQVAGHVSHTPGSSFGSSPVIIQSNGMKGYDVFVDEVYIGSDGKGGDALDGRFSFSVKGNMQHLIRVYDGQFNYPKSIFFAAGETKIIRVEPGTAVFI